MDGCVGLPGFVVKGRLASSFDGASLVEALIHGDSPEERREPRFAAVPVPMKEELRERLLRQVLGAMDVAGHLQAQSSNRLFPAAYEERERLPVVAALDASHRLFVRERE
jgi:hypothetical protein